MNVDDLVDELVEERSLDALERLTGSTADEVLESLIGAAARLMAADRFDDNDDRIVETIRQHLVDAKAVGVCVDALQDKDVLTREFALSVLSEIGDTIAVPAMIPLLKDAEVREAAAEHLALLTHYDFGQDAEKWRDWYQRLVQGRLEQAKEDMEDKERMLRLQLRGKRGGEEGEEGGLDEGETLGYGDEDDADADRDWD